MKPIFTALLIFAATHLSVEQVHAALVGNSLTSRLNATDGAVDVFQVYFNAPLPAGTLYDFEIYNQAGTGSFDAFILRPLGGNQYQVVVKQALAVSGSNAGVVNAYPITPIAVASGDLIAHRGIGIPYTDGALGGAFQQIFYHTPNSPNLNDVITLPSANFPQSAADGANFGGTFIRDYALAVSVGAADRLVAHYTFDNPLALAEDSSPNGYDGIVNGATAAAGISGGAISVTGGTNVISGNLTPSVNSTTTQSVAVWFNAADGGGGGVIVGELGQPTAGVGWNDSQIELQLNNTLETSVWNYQASTASAVLSEDWHHAVLVYDASTGALTNYVDGALVQTVNFGARQAPWQAGYQQLFGFGAAPNPTNLGNPNGFNGLIDDVQVYNVALNAGQALYLFQNPGAVVPEPSAFLLLSLGIATICWAKSRR